MKILLVIFAVVAGIVLPIQAGLNAKMARHIGHPIFATTVSFLVGTIGLITYALIAGLPTHQLKNYDQATLGEWIPGLLGAFYVAATVILVPRLGAALTFALIITGQMAISVVLDHFGLIGLPVKAATWTKLTGILLLVVGVLLIRQSS